MHLTAIGRRLGETPQTESAAENQVQNNAGGFVFPVDEWTRLDRFLIIGSTKSYYESTQKLSSDNALHLMQMITKHGIAVVARIVAISEDGRAPKQDYGIFALAACAGRGNLETRRAAMDAIPKVCRTGSTLLQFVSYIEQFRGWGRALRDGIAQWYEGKDSDQLAYQLIKYQNRHGWTHRDVLRVAHPRHTPLLQWAAKKPTEVEALPQIVRDFIATSNPDADKVALAKVLPREALPTEWLNDAKVWEALLMGGKGMPLFAMIRNLATMTRIGLLKPGSDATKYVVGRLSDQDGIKHSRVHPAAILVALATYRSGKSERGSSTWIPTPEIYAALDAAFYLAFGNVVPSGKRTLIGLDVSGSMDAAMTATPGLSAREATTAMAMIQIATEPEIVGVLGFTAAHSGSGLNGTALLQMPFTKGQTLTDAMAYTRRIPFGATDCALPMLGALESGLKVDTFVIYTDNETYAGRSMHPFEALRRYRSQTGIPAKLAVVGTTATAFTIADPSDAGMLDVAGFDAHMPALIADFARAAMVG